MHVKNNFFYMVVYGFKYFTTNEFLENNKTLHFESQVSYNSDDDNIKDILLVLCSVP